MLQRWLDSLRHSFERRAPRPTGAPISQAMARSFGERYVALVRAGNRRASRALECQRIYRERMLAALSRRQPEVRFVFRRERDAAWLRRPRVLGLREGERGWRPLVRDIRGDAVFYAELELVAFEHGPKVVDLFTHTNRAWTSEVAAEQVEVFVAAGRMPSLNRIWRHLATDEPALALAVIVSMPALVRESPAVQQLEANLRRDWSTLDSIDRLAAEIDDPYLDALRADIHLREGALEQARAAADRAVVSDPDEGLPHDVRFRVCVAQGAFADALASLEQLRERFHVRYSSEAIEALPGGRALLASAHWPRP